MGSPQTTTSGRCSMAHSRSSVGSFLFMIEPCTRRIDKPGASIRSVLPTKPFNASAEPAIARQSIAPCAARWLQTSASSLIFGSKAGYRHTTRNGPSTESARRASGDGPVKEPARPTIQRLGTRSAQPGANDIVLSMSSGGDMQTGDVRLRIVARRESGTWMRFDAGHRRVIAPRKPSEQIVSRLQFVAVNGEHGR